MDPNLNLLILIHLGQFFFPECTIRGPFYVITNRPPEYFHPRNINYFNPFAGEIWAAATVILEFITGIHIFQQDDNQYAPIGIYQAYRDDTNISLEEFSEDIAEGYLSDRINVKRFLNEYLDLINLIIIEMLSQMLFFNPDERLTTEQMCDMLGVTFNLLSIINLVPDYFNHVYNAEGVGLIIAITKKLEMCRPSTVIAIEIFSRYLFMNDQSLIDELARACVNIVHCLMYNKLAFKENNIMEAEILQKLNYLIYNMDLKPVIARLNKISNLSPEYFSGRLEEWLKR